MRGYTIKNVTNRGDYTYAGEDHILDAFNLAVYGFQREYGNLLNNRLVYNILFLNDPRLAEYPQRADAPEAVPSYNNSTYKNIRDPELPQPSPRKLIGPSLIRQPFKRSNIKVNSRGF
jgi:hypothetical protein